MTLTRQKNCGFNWPETLATGCFDCCNRSGPCSWDPCTTVKAMWWIETCYYSDSGCTAGRKYGFGEPDNNSFTPKTSTTQFAGPDWDEIRDNSSPTGCYSAGVSQICGGMYWRSKDPINDVQVWDTTPGLPFACPPQSVSSSTDLWLWSMHTHTADQSNGNYWRTWRSGPSITLESDANDGAGNCGGTPNGWANYDIEYGCCGAETVAHSTCSEETPGSLWKKVTAEAYLVIGTQSACCRDTTDFTDPLCDPEHEDFDIETCPQINSAWGIDPTSGLPNCCASCEDGYDCVIDLPLL